MKVPTGKALSTKWLPVWSSILTAFCLSLLVPSAAQAKLLLKCDFETIDPVSNVTPCLDHLAPNSNPSATVFGNPATTTGRPPVAGGSSTTALVFDGVDDYVHFSGAVDLVGEKAFTVEAWVKVTSFSNNVFRVQQPIVLHSDAFRIHKTGGWHDRLTAVVSPPFNEWYHLAGVFDRGELRVYVNGRLANVDTFGTENLDSLDATGTFTDWGIGARLVGAAPDQFFTGQIDEVSVYDEPLTALQILQHARDANLGTVLNVQDPPYNAAGDGVADDTTAIQNALDHAAPNGSSAGADVLLPSGIYRLSATLSVPTGVLVRGEDGTILKPLGLPSSTFSPMFLFSNVSDSTLRDLELQGFAAGLESDTGHLGILMEGTQRVHIDHVIIQELGKNLSAINVLPSGAHIRVTGLAGENPIQSERNVIENNVLDDSRRITNFGIRFKTDWLGIDPTQAPVLQVKENVVKNNLLKGFLQAIEIAGPGTTNNWIRGNFSMGAEESGIEADKGAKFNVYLDNHVRLPRSDTNALVAGMRDQGTFQCDGNTIDYELFNEGNVFRRNLITDVWNQKNAGGILVARSIDLVFRDNYIRDVRAGNPADAGVVLLAPTGVTNRDIFNNLTSGVLNDEVILPPNNPCP